MIINRHIRNIDGCYQIIKINDCYVVCSKREALHLLVRDQKMIDKFVFFDRPLLASDADRNICLIEYLFGNLPIVMLKKIAPFRPDVGQILLMEVFEEIWGVKYFQKLLENFDKSYWSKKAESKYTEFLQAFNLDISTVLTQEDTEKLLDLLDM